MHHFLEVYHIVNKKKNKINIEMFNLIIIYSILFINNFYSFIFIAKHKIIMYPI